MSVDQENPNPQPSPEDELPDWLKEIRGEAPASEAKPAPPVSDLPTESVADIEELPPWLQDVPPDVEVPDTVEEVAEDETEVVAEAAKSEADGSAMWQQILEEEGISLDDVPEERPEGAEDMSVADYMEATADESAKRLAQADKQPSAQPVDVEPETELPVAEVEDDGMVIDDELPDWLKDESVAEAEGDSASWLMDESVADETVAAVSDAVTAESESVAESVPDWLKPDEVEATAEAVDDGMVIENELPDWLKDEAVAEADSEPETPSWLSDESIITSAAEVRAAVEASADVEESASEDAETLPDWLQEDAEIEPEMEAETPAWLLDETSVEEEPTAVEEDLVELDEPVAKVDESIGEPANLPDWLQEDTDAEGALEAETPEWLVDETVAEAEEPADTEMANDGLVIEDELPDWLKAETEADSEAEEWLASEIAEEPVAEIGDDFLDDADLPDWLQEGEEMWSEAEEEVVETETATTAAIDSEAPEWLSDESVAEAEVTEIAEVEEPTEPEKEPVVAEAAIEDKAEETEVVEMEAAVVAEAPMVVKTDDVFVKAQKALEVGQLSEALETFNGMIAESMHLEDIVSELNGHLSVFSDNPAIYETLGDAHARLGQLNQAFQSYKKALQKL